MLRRIRKRYDTIRDAILTCARKPTWVGFIYRTETTTKNCKTEKLKSKSRYVGSNSKSLGNHVNSPGNLRSQSQRRKGRLRWEGFAEKAGLKPGMKEWAVMNDASGESMEPMEEVPLIKLGESENGDISAWLTDRSRELISETRRSSWCIMSLFLILLFFF